MMMSLQDRATALAAGWRPAGSRGGGIWHHPDFPNTTFTTAAVLHRLDAAHGPLSVACPCCESMPGQQCRTSFGRRLPRSRPHAARLRRWVGA